MNEAAMTSMQRVLTTLGHQEPDRVPLFLLLSLHGAKELGLSIKDYFAKAENVVLGQLRLRAKYGHDCLDALFYAPIEVEAFGGEVVFADDGPPNSAEPFLKRFEDIDHLTPPRIDDSPCLTKVLHAISALKARSGGEAPIIGVVMSPFSLPVMQLGFERYLVLIHEQPTRFERLMRINEEFCVAFANAQLAAGATAIVYFDPVSSPTIIPRTLYVETGLPVARRTLARIPGATAMHFASGRCLPIIEDVISTGTAAVGVSVEEDLVLLKAACRGKLSLVGNLNGIAMRHWSPAQAEATVKTAIAQAGKGGGFIVSDNHGEIPWQVPDEVLHAIAQAVRRWGQYPLQWPFDHEE